MRLLRTLLLGAFCALVPLCPPAAQAASGDDAGAQPLDRIVAIVNNGVVLKSELDAEIRRVRARLERQGQSAPDREVLRKRVLDQLVLQKIQLQKASQQGISVDDDAVNRALRSMADDRGTDLEGLRKRIADEGMDFDQLRSDVRDQLIMSQLRQREVASQVQVSEQEVNDFLARLKRSSQQNVEYHLRHILIELPTDASTDEVEQAQQRARAIVAQLRQGSEDFATMAQRVSDGQEALSGGDLGWRARTQLPSLFVDALDKLKPGDVSDPLRSPNGFHIIKLIDRRGGQPQTITETHARHILLRADASEDNPRQELARLRQRIESGASFAELARAHSDDQASASQGGDLGWFGPDEMTPAFQQVVDGLQPGQISEPFRTPYGWHIVQVLGRRQRTDVEEYQRSQARQALYKRRVEEETQRWLRQLRDEAYVDLRLDD